ncbi:UNVERIFIED_CONTAM: Glucose-induced degradation protein 4-like protein [Trichonephila clavipes]
MAFRTLVTLKRFAWYSISDVLRNLNVAFDSATVKEHFLVPDHTIKDISGASFAGFYYICFQKSSSTIEGYYYHRSSEW